jgi:hypothetical protein
MGASFARPTPAGICWWNSLTLAGEGEAPVSFRYTGHAQPGPRIPRRPAAKVIDIAGPDAVRQAMYEVLEADRKPDGQLCQDKVFRYVLAAKP